jgi:hypothetical protein
MREWRATPGRRERSGDPTYYVDRGLEADSGAMVAFK